MKRTENYSMLIHFLKYLKYVAVLGIKSRDVIILQVLQPTFDELRSSMIELLPGNKCFSLLGEGYRRR